MSNPDLGGLFEQAAKMQEQLMSAQAEAATRTVTGQAGGGVVKVTATGGGEFTSVTISPEAVDPDDVEMLQDLVLAAIHDAAHQVAELQQQALGGLGALLGGGADAGGLGDLGKLLGGGPAAGGSGQGG